MNERCKKYAAKYRKFGRKTKREEQKFLWHKSWHVTDEDVKRNLEKVEQGQDLDMPLAVLDGTFKKIYSNETNKACKREKIKTEEYKEHFKKWKKEHYSRPGVKRRIRLKLRKYNSRPEIKARNIEKARKFYIVMATLREIYKQEVQEIGNTLKDMHWNKRRSKVNTILRRRHKEEYDDLFKVAKTE